MHAADLRAASVLRSFIKGAERPVHQQNARFEDHGASERHTLLLSTGELLGIPPAVIGQNGISFSTLLTRAAISLSFPRRMVSGKGEAFFANVMCGNKA